MKLMNYSFKLKKNHLVKKLLIREKTLSNESYFIVLLSSEKIFFSLETIDIINPFWSLNEFWMKIHFHLLFLNHRIIIYAIIIHIVMFF